MFTLINIFQLEINKWQNKSWFSETSLSSNPLIQFESRNNLSYNSYPSSFNSGRNLSMVNPNTQNIVHKQQP